MKIEDIAMICHEANRAYCEAMGDKSQVPWVCAEAWQQESAIAGVRFSLDNEDITGEQQHEAWRKHKEADGWAWGVVKDASRKLHPCMVPYAELPPLQQAKDHIFRAIVRACGKL